MNECKDVNHSYDFTSKHFWNLKHMSYCLQSMKKNENPDAVKLGLQGDKRSMLLGKINQFIYLTFIRGQFKRICIQALCRS